MDDAIELHQALHGYGDGHQLLSSSLELTREQEWQLLVMSDLSGPSFRAGFESYITGYPLTSGGYYCFARTWYAPEMPRPGCVWTHTILISDTDVARIGDFRALESNFRRPLSQQDLDAYSKPVDFRSFGLQPSRLNPDASALLIYLLYGSPSRTVVQASESSNLYEELIFAIFNQQWPRLRRSFRFCTGALAIRETAFDLAIAPPDAVRQGSDSSKTVMLTPGTSDSMTRLSSEEWVRIAVDDLMKADSQSSLRQFLWKFGPDYDNGRTAFRPLCEIHLAASRKVASVDQTLSAVAHFYPTPDHSKRLKAEFFGAGGYYSATPAGESSVLNSLVTHPAANCVPEDIAAIESRSQLLVASDQESAKKIATIASSVGGVRARYFLDGFSAGISSNPGILEKLSLPLTIDLIKRRPTLLTAPEIWKRSAGEQFAIASYISLLSKESKMGRNVTEAVLRARAWRCLPTVMSHFKQPAIIAVLEWIDQIPINPLSVPKPILSALGEYRHEVIRILQQNLIGVRSLRVAALILDPRSDDVRALGVSTWIRLVDSNVHFASTDDEIRTRAFLLSLGLSLKGDGDVLLVREGFSEVYAAVRASSLSDDLWAYIEPHLPWYLITRDRCALLIRGVVREFIDRGWAASEFIATFSNEEQFERALQEADRTYWGSHYIKQVCKGAKDGTLHLLPHHKLPLSQFCDLK